MDDRGYIAQALFDRLSAEGVAFRVQGDARRYPESAPPEARIAVARAAFGAVPRLAARFSQEYDLQLVQLAREPQAWRFALAWSDDVGRPRFLPVQALGEALSALERLAGRLAAVLAPRSASVLFVGRESSLRSSVMIHVARDLAPLGLRFHEDRPGERRRADFRIVFGARGPLAPAREDVAAVAAGQDLALMVAEAERAILRWLECRVERRFPDAVVGVNPLPARLLQTKIPYVRQFAGALLNCHIACPIRAPILMPYPYGIVIEEGAVIGSRVTVMQQASLHGAPVIEDNVCIGPGARILGEVRIGRGATVGANAVVTRDVPSHCTVVGSNRILGVEPPAVAAERLAERKSVVNT
ncbi:MAG: serine acetyltransferase [Betaproteobacteria bacterium]